MASTPGTGSLPVPYSPVSSRAPQVASKATLINNIPAIRHRLSRLCQEGKPHLALQLFDTIPRPTTILSNTIIIGFICNNLPLQALLFYAQIKHRRPSSLPPHPTRFDSYTYSSALKACALTRNLMVGKAIHGHFLRCLPFPNRVVYNSLLSMYATCYGGNNNCDFSNYDLVRTLFDQMRERDVVAWNTIVSWYVKTERYVEAIGHFRMMLSSGVKPSPISFVGVFPAFSGAKDLNNANVAYGMVLKWGGEFENDLFVVSSAILMYAEFGFINFARQVFDRCTEKNAEIWNTMISGYVQNECFLEAASHLQSFQLAQQLHAFVVKSLVVLPVRILNAIVVLYSRCNSIHSSFDVFEKMTERDTVSWNTMISALVQNGMDNEGLMLVHEMQKQGFAIDSVTVTALLSMASNLRGQEIGKQTHAYLLRHGIRFEGMDSYLIEMYAKFGLIQTSRHIFDSCYVANRNHATWNAMIAGYTQCGLNEEAFLILRQMLEQHVLPDAVTLASILPACIPFGSIELGRQLHGVCIRHCLEQNIFVRTALVDMYSKSGLINCAETLFMKSPKKNSVTYTTMILGYGQHGMGEKALSLFHSMLKSGIEPDAITFVAILSACSHTGLVDEGLQIFKSMLQDFKIQPSSQHHCCVADMLGRVGRVVEAFEFVNQLGDEGNVLEIWGSLLASCRIHGHNELGELVGRKLFETDITGSLAGYHVLLSNIYAEEGNWENVGTAPSAKGTRTVAQHYREDWSSKRDILYQKLLATLSVDYSKEINLPRHYQHVRFVLLPWHLASFHS
ncbi:hypothetical protein Tsubulata_024216 [Turnera subulata]|uniref:Pentatricopeptide repeat-containing protein n=1 Tax=Turnera subulata TaxID=218843 RepID=A0A9Q0G9H6_9ROSI|nr:hypothetical protein Tsubulata_024216 [Turnera subulata]